MKRSIVLHVAWTSLVVASSAFAGDELFSEIRTESVYGFAGASANSGEAALPDPIGPSIEAPRSADTEVPIAGPASLSEALRNAGFEPKEVNSQYLSVEIEAEGAKRTAFATVSEDRKRVQFVLPLSTLAKGATLSTDRLTTLMEANRADRAERFAFSARLGRIELHRSLENRDVTGKGLRETLETMVAVADETTTLWKLDDATPSAPSSAGSTTSVAENAPTTPASGGNGSSSLVGSWTASRSKTQAFALRLGTDGKFALVTVDGSRNATSTGTFVLGDGKLSLNDAKGGSLAGTIALRSSEEFEFSPAGSSAAALVFKRAK